MKGQCSCQLPTRDSGDLGISWLPKEPRLVAETHLSLGASWEFCLGKPWSSAVRSPAQLSFPLSGEMALGHLHGSGHCLPAPTRHHATAAAAAMPAPVAGGIQGKRNGRLRIIKGRKPFLPGQELPMLHSSPRACSLENSVPGTTHGRLNLRMVLLLPRMGRILFLGFGHFSEKCLKLTYHLGSEHD